MTRSSQGSELRALVLAPLGRDGQIACAILEEASIDSMVCVDRAALRRELELGAGLAVIAEEALYNADLSELVAWIEGQPPWSDFPFVLLAQRGGGLERNPGAGRLVAALGNVTFVERPFHPTTLVSVVQTSLRGRHRQYEARDRIEALRDAETQFRTMAESIPQLAWMAEPDGHIFWYNQRWYDYTGARPEDLEGWGWQTVHDPKALPSVIERWTACLDTGQPFEMIFPLRSAAGEFRQFLTRVEPVRGADGQIVRWLGTNTDITDQQEAEALLAQRVEERTRERDMVWRTSENLFAIIGRNGRYTTVSPAWTAALGYAASDLIGLDGRELVHPDDIAERGAEFARVSRGEAVRDIDLRVRAKDGSYKWFSWTVISAGDGLLYAEGRDVTERRHLEDQLRQAQKMEAVGQLTGGIAHDFNNLLTGIIGSLELLQKRIASGRTGDIERLIGLATSSANRAAALTHRLLAFSRRQPLDPKPVNANGLVESMAELVRRTIGESIDFSIVAGEGLWRTLCDPHQLESGVLNLAINARDAMPHGGSITITTRNASLDAAYAIRHSDVRVGDYVAISVTDTGVGMPPDVVERAFDPFFTTKPLGQGTGLGLSMIYGFARQSDGHVKIESEPGRGTTVTLYLPRYLGAEDDAEASNPEAPEQPRDDQKDVVLVVEDEPAVRELVVEVLSELGFQALEAADAKAAIALVETADVLDLLITDIGLPGMNGRQLADAVRERRPDLRVLFMTGYAENAAMGGGMLEPGMELITKPFTLGELSRRIRAITEREAASSR